MVKLLDLDLSRGAFILRMIFGVIVGTINVMLFYYIPTSIASLASGYLPSNNVSSFNAFISGLVNPLLPIIGIALGVFGFLGILFRGTRIYGLFVSCIGVLFVAYTYVFFQGGTIHVNIPYGLVHNVSGNLELGLNLLMLLFVIPSLLTIVKGAVLLIQATHRVQNAPTIKTTITS